MVSISWWTLGLLIASSIVIGQLLRLGPHLLEVPSSAMLVLALGGAESAAADRLTATLIGAAVGMAVNLAFPPSVRARSAAEAVEGFARDVADLLESASKELAEPLSVEKIVGRAQSAGESARRTRCLGAHLGGRTQHVPLDPGFGPALPRRGRRVCAGDPSRLR